MSGKYDADVLDREFVRAYFTDFDDGKPVDRVLDSLCSIIEN